MKKGVSLIELIIYIGIVAIVLVVMTELAARLIFAQAQSAKNSEVTQNLNFVVEKLTTDIENAKTVSATQSVLTLTMRDNSQIIYTATTNKMTKQKDLLSPVAITNSKVRVTVSPSTPIFQIIANSAVKSVKINLPLSGVANSSDQQTAQITVFPRSK